MEWNGQETFREGVPIEPDTRAASHDDAALNAFLLANDFGGLTAEPLRRLGGRGLSGE